MAGSSRCRRRERERERGREEVKLGVEVVEKSEVSVFPEVSDVQSRDS